MSSSFAIGPAPIVAITRSPTRAEYAWRDPVSSVRCVREADRMLAEGIEVPEVAKALEVSEAIYHRWRAQFGGMKADDVKRLRELERENQTLKRIVANKELEIEGLREIARGNW